MFIRGDVRLRPLEPEDVPILTEWVQNEKVRENLLLRLPLSAPQESKWLEGLYKDSARAIFGIEVENPTWDFVGVCGLEGIDRSDGRAMVGIFLGDVNLWGKGFGTKALRVLLEIGFNELRLNRVGLEVFTENERAIRSYEKLGFVREGILREKHFRAGRFVDAQVMSVLAREYKNQEHPARVS